MRVLYNYWGHLTDKIGISSADGNFSYSWSIIQELKKRKHTVYGPPINRDKEVFSRYKTASFSSFSSTKRLFAYKALQQFDLNNLPDIDVILLEWRFKTKYNQLPYVDLNRHPDLDIQNILLQLYSNKQIKLIILDLDGMLQNADEDYIIALGYKNVIIYSQSQIHSTYKILRKTMYIPFDMSELLQHEIKTYSGYNHLTYIGNDYNRREDIDNNIKQYAKAFPSTVRFVGNWYQDFQTEYRNSLEGVLFYPRIGANEFKYFLSDSVAVPLLATNEYKKSGAMTMRILESILFGSIPIGFSDFYFINKWLPNKLIVDVSDSFYCLKSIIDYLLHMSIKDMHMLRALLAERLEFHDARYFVDEVTL